MALTLAPQKIRIHQGCLTWLLLAALLLNACQVGTSQAVDSNPVNPTIEPVITSAASLPVSSPAINNALPKVYLGLVQKSSPRVSGQTDSGGVLTPTQGTPTNTPAVIAPPPGQTPEAKLFLPDSEVVFGPSALDFDIAAYLKEAGGYLASYHEYLESTGWTGAAEILDRVALANSVNPRLLLALLDYQCNCVRGPDSQGLKNGYALGAEDYHRKGLYGQLWWAANQLSAGFYGWSEGWLKEYTLPNGTLFKIEPGSNPGSAALQIYFARLWNIQDQSAIMGSQTWVLSHPNAFGEDQWRQALDPQHGFLEHYAKMFGDYSTRARQVEPLVPGNLRQPQLILPFEKGRLWSFTSGPHQAWENEGSQAALDFAPASNQTGCWPSKAWVVAAGNGPVVRVGSGMVVQDLDGPTPSDGKEQTGWAILYMHVDSQDRAAMGAYLHAGDRIGHPSCEGGPATGTHLHIARKYNGEWIAAAGALPFVLDGWTAQSGQKKYEGKLVKDNLVVIAHWYASFETHISRPESDPTAEPGPLLKTNRYDH